MAKEKQLGITVKKEEDFSEWYNQIVLKAELADYAPVRGFMIIRPNAYRIWENIQHYFNERLFSLGVKNAYFPLLIPESFFRKEAEHAEGFAPELAWIEKEEEEERVAIRPTSETIMYDSYAKWVRGWRDLPLRINQWCNILRWEVKQTKLFLRTREFLWQEGHCVYETEEECREEALLILNEYKRLCEELLAIPVIVGEKTENERFAGAKQTFTAEALMPDGKALQMGTSHNLGQNFAKSFNVKFLGREGKEKLAWQNSWGFSTRLIGALVMVHGDNKGFLMPPMAAHTKIVIVPILFEKTKQKVLSEAKKLERELKPFNAFLDDREGYSAGRKYNEWELKGIPLRIELGPEDIAKKQAVLVRRDSGRKKIVRLKNLKKEIGMILEDIQKSLFNKAKKFLQKNTVEVKNWQQFKKAIDERKMALAFFCESSQCEEAIKEETTATNRCIPFGQKGQHGKCVKCNGKSARKSYFAKAY